MVFSEMPFSTYIVLCSIDSLRKLWYHGVYLEDRAAIDRAHSSAQSNDSGSYIKVGVIFSGYSILQENCTL